MPVSFTSCFAFRNRFLVALVTRCPTLRFATSDNKYASRIGKLSPGNVPYKYSYVENYFLDTFPPLIAKDAASAVALVCLIAGTAFGRSFLLFSEPGCGFLIGWTRSFEQVSPLIRANIGCFNFNSRVIVEKTRGRSLFTAEGAKLSKLNTRVIRWFINTYTFIDILFICYNNNITSLLRKVNILTIIHNLKAW